MPHTSHYGNPGPLGLCAFALTTFVLSMFNLQAAGITTPNVIVGLALAYGGLAQLCAGMWEFACGNTFGATAFTSYGGFWISFGLIFIPGSGILEAFTDVNQLENALGLYLLGWAIFTTIMLIASLKSNRVSITLFASLAVTFLLLSLGKFLVPANVDTATIFTKMGGYLGVFTACVAWYSAAGQLINKETSYFELPQFPIVTPVRVQRKEEMDVETGSLQH
ncbi:hypothetical protein HDU98_006367 [Podochytrium sp. JEL0797]|nr:hypothetical protein HDU98_006367 [Podochytrium sp. JEL0797]